MGSLSNSDRCKKGGHNAIRDDCWPVGRVLFCAWVVRAAPDQESGERQASDKQKEMIDAAGRAYEASAALYDVGAGGVTLEGVYTWRCII